MHMNPMMVHPLYIHNAVIRLFLTLALGCGLFILLMVLLCIC